VDTADIARTFAGIVDTTADVSDTTQTMSADIGGTSPTRVETGAWQTRNHALGMDRIDTGKMCAETMDDQDGDAGTAVIPNARLAQRLRAKGLSHARFATGVGVDVKTVRRWLANANYKVRDDNARRAADVLDCTPHDLWPRQFPPSTASTLSTTPAGPFTPTLYASRTQLPVTAWQRHFADATTGIDILVLAATFLFDTLDGFLDTLLDAAARGVAVRFLVGDPDTATMTIRGEEEGIGEAVIARCRTSVELLTPHAGTPGLHIRTHDTTLYTSIFRVDDSMIVNFHIYGSPGRNNPVLVLSRHHEPRLWATLEQAFTQVWDNATPLTAKG
jgi:lambda repressor-like predicted transcriptional regulator